MLLTGTVKEILKPDNSKNIFLVVISKTRKGKPIEISIIFWGHLSKAIEENLLKIRDKIDIQFYIYSKPFIYAGRKNYNSYLVAERWRHYVTKQDRFIEVANHNTGEVIKINGKI